MAARRGGQGRRRIRIRARAVVYGVGLIVLVGLMAFGPVLAPYDPFHIEAQDRLLPPSRDHLAGTDQFGRDQFSRILYGARISLGVGMVATVMALLLGGILGLASGFLGGKLDGILGLLMDVLFAFPPLLLALAIVATSGPGTTKLMPAIAIVYTPIFYRISRSASLVVRGLLYVEAAVALGAGTRRILFRHVLPNAAGPIIVQATLGVAFAILAEAALSFLGLGTPPPMPSWGTMLFEGRRVMSVAPWLAIFPGITISLAILYCNLSGDYLRDRLDPVVERTWDAS